MAHGHQLATEGGEALRPERVGAAGSTQIVSDLVLLNHGAEENISGVGGAGFNGDQGKRRNIYERKKRTEGSDMCRNITSPVTVTF